MRYWLTQHYPKLRLPELYNIYLKKRFSKRLEPLIGIGDRVAFYETAGVLENGRSAVIAIGRVSKELCPNKHPPLSPEDEGTEVWPCEAPCDQIHFGEGVVLARVKEILGWGKRRPPIIAGGVLEITAKQFESIAVELDR